MPQLYKDYIPANARVVVDYTKEDKVKFSYPVEYTYWGAVYKCVYSNILSLIIYIIGKLLKYVGLALLVYVAISSVHILYDSCIAENHAMAFGNNTSNSTSLCEAQFDFSGLMDSSPEIVEIDINPIGRVFLFFAIGLILFFIIPLIFVTIIGMKKEWLSKVAPKIGYWNSYVSGDLYRKIFVPEDVIGNRAIIPIFGNAYLDYECYGEFGKYLEKIEIMELQCDKERVPMFPFRRYKVVKEEYSFSAVFTFSQKPIEGKMIVVFG